MSQRTPNKTPKKIRRPKVKWYNEWTKMSIALFLVAAVAVGIAAVGVRAEPGTTLNTLSALLLGIGGLCIIGSVGLVIWKLAEQVMLRRISCPKCQTRNRIPRRLTHYQCSGCGKRTRV